MAVLEADRKRVLALAAAGATFAVLWAREWRRRSLVTRDLEFQLTAVTALERRAAIGQLMAAISHELGQPIAAILRNTEAARMILATDHPSLQKLTDIVDDIRTSDKRAHELLQRLRAAFKNQPFEIQHVDLKRVVEDTLGLAGPLAAERGVTLLATGNGAGPFIVSGDTLHLGQVMLNLVLNGIDAVTGLSRAERRVTLSLSTLGEHVGVDIADSGTGFSADALERAFEPFFTTKPEGMGMGLVIARHIVNRHGGSLMAGNHEDGGAIVRVRLLRCDAGGEDDHGLRFD